MFVNTMAKISLVLSICAAYAATSIMLGLIIYALFDEVSTSTCVGFSCGVFLGLLVNFQVSELDRKELSDFE